MFINIEGALSAIENLGNKFAFRHYVHKGRKLSKEEIIAVLKAGQSRGYKTTKEFTEGEIDIVLTDFMSQVKKPIFDRGFKSDGTKHKGAKIIELLEKAGGVNVHKHDGSMQDLFYYINEKREITGNIVLPVGYWCTGTELNMIDSDNSRIYLDETKEPANGNELPTIDKLMFSSESIKKYTEYVDLLNQVHEFMILREETDFDPRTPMFMADFYLHMTAKLQAPADINNDTLKNVLSEAILQIEYLHMKYKPTGSGEKVLAMIRNYKQSLA